MLTLSNNHSALVGLHSNLNRLAFGPTCRERLTNADQHDQKIMGWVEPVLNPTFDTLQSSKNYRCFLGQQIPRFPRQWLRFLLILSLLALSILYFHFSPSHGAGPFTLYHQTQKPKTSFVASLEHFLLHRPPKSPPPARRIIAIDDVVRDLDESMHRIESERLWGDSYFLAAMPIRVYVYEMPSKFTYDLLWLFRNTYRDTSNLTSNDSPVHHLIE